MFDKEVMYWIYLLQEPLRRTSTECATFSQKWLVWRQQLVIELFLDCRCGVGEQKVSVGY